MNSEESKGLQTEIIMDEPVDDLVQDDINVSKSSDQSAEIACENPFVKFVRGFSDVPDESVRKMR